MVVWVGFHSKNFFFSLQNITTALVLSAKTEYKINQKQDRQLTTKLKSSVLNLIYWETFVLVSKLEG